MRHLFFNELSIHPLANSFGEAWNRINNFILTYKNRPTDTFESRICSECHLGDLQLCSDLTLQAFCKDTRGRTLGSLLLGLTKHPYIDSNSPQEDQYIASSFSIKKDSAFVATYGLAAAYLHDSVGISFDSEEFWQKLEYCLRIISNGNSTDKPILSVSCPQHFTTKVFAMWRENHARLNLAISATQHDKKKINLREDHGIDILDAFARKIVRSPYVVEIVNSLPFNPHSSNFIKSVHETGLIEIVLTSTDTGYGMVIQTTGRNLRETAYIASILQSEFGK